jgi:MFS family permease
VVVLAGVAGPFVDRRDARSVLIGASLAQAAIAAVMALTVDSIAATIGLAALLGSGFAFAQPAEFSLVPVVAAGGDLNRANGFVETARYVGMTAGPLLGGLLAAAGSTRIALLVNAFTFVAVALAGSMLKARRPPQPAGRDGQPRAREGLTVLFGDRVLGLVVTVAFASLLLMTASATAEVFFIKQDLGASDLAYGFLFSCWMVGMVTGALVVSRRVAGASLAFVALMAIAVQSVGLALPTVWLEIGLAASAWVVGGLGHGTKNVLIRTLIQERVAAALHGRAFAAYNGLRNGAELVALALGGLLVATAGARVTLALAGAIPLSAALAGLVLYRRERAAAPAPHAASP